MLDLFHDQTTELPDAELCGDHQLLKRAGARDATFRIHGFRAEHNGAKHDVNYIARDNIPNSIKESQVYHIAKLIDS